MSKIIAENLDIVEVDTGNFDGYRQKRQRKTVEVTQRGGAEIG